MAEKNHEQNMPIWYFWEQILVLDHQVLIWVTLRPRLTMLPE